MTTETAVLTRWATLTDEQRDAIYFSAMPDSPLDEAPSADADGIEFLAEVLGNYDNAGDFLAAMDAADVV